MLAKTITIPAPLKNAALYSVWFTVTESGRICQFFSCREGYFFRCHFSRHYSGFKQDCIRQSTPPEKLH
jgi:hypothetical protein